MIELLPLAILILSGIGTTAFGLFKAGKYGALFSACSFVPLLFLKPHTIKINWFNISNLNFDLSFNFWESEILLCLIITLILVCLYFARPISFFDDSIERKFGVLNIFLFFMCGAILSDNILQFYIGIEALGLISTILVSLEKNADKEATKVFMFNKFASLIFLVAVVLIVLETKSFDISDIRKFCLSEESSKLFIPACLLLVSCFCKGTQFPFSHWLIDAVKANMFASILIHAGTIVAVGIIFIAKFYFIFDCFPILKIVMLTVGLFTSFWMACCALVHNDIKKIIACLTSSSAGIMFIACGLGGYSLAILYFICHAFFKSMLFLSFAYLISSMSGEKCLDHLGGLAKMAPKITDIVWTSFLFAAGFPFLSGFFAKISLMGTIDISDMDFLAIGIIAINMIAITAIFRMLFRSLYGETLADDQTLSRASKSNEYDMKPFWFLACFSIFGSFTIWTVFEWGDLHFGKAGIVYIWNSMDYMVEIFSSISQIAIAILLLLMYEKYSTRYMENGIGPAISIFRQNEIYKIFNIVLRETLKFIMGIFNLVQNYTIREINKCSFRSIYQTGNFLINKHRSLLRYHAVWLLLGITVAFALTLFEGMFR